MAVASSVVPMACPKPFNDAAMPRHLLGASAALVCARPAFGSPFAIVTPLAPMGVAHLTPRSAPPSAVRRTDVRSLVDRSATPRTCTTRPAARRCRPHRASSPPHRQGIAPIAPRSKPRTQGGPLQEAAPRPWGGRRSARTGPPRSFLPIAALLVPAGPGRNATPARASRTNAPTLEEAHARMPSTRPLPVECTGRPTRPNNTRPNAPPVVVPHGSLNALRSASACKEGRAVQAERSIRSGTLRTELVQLRER